MGADGRDGTSLSVTPHQQLRWAFLLVAVGLLTAGKLLGLVQASSGSLVASLALAGLVVWSLGRPAQPEWLRQSRQTLLTVYDLLLAGLLAFFFGPGVVALAVLAAAVPQSFDCEVRARPLVPPFAALTYLGAVAWHRLVFDPPWWRIPAVVFVETLLLLSTTWLLAFRYSQILRRIRSMSRTIGLRQMGEHSQSSRGALDDLAVLERSLHGARVSIDSAVAALRQAAGDGERLATEIGTRAQSSVAAARDLAPLAAELATAIPALHSNLRQRAARAEEAVAEWGQLVTQTELAQVHLDDMMALLVQQRDRSASILRAVREASDHLDKAKDAADRLVDSFRGVDAVAQQIMKISRHTHVLALNAAIEAAHAGEHGSGFALVAEQVKRLAAEARLAAREVVDRTATIHAETETLTRDITTQNSLLQGLHAATGDVKTALAKLVEGAEQTRELGRVTDTAATTRSKRIAEALGSLDGLLPASERWSAAAESVAAGVRHQIDETARLDEVAHALESLAADLRAAAERLVAHQTVPSRNCG